MSRQYNNCIRRKTEINDSINDSFLSRLGLKLPIHDSNNVFGFESLSKSCLSFESFIFREVRKAMAIHMVLSSEGSENIRCFLVFLDKANGSKIVPPTPITCWGDGSAMFQRLHHKNDGQAKIVKW
jgi:hypothetical protein